MHLNNIMLVNVLPISCSKRLKKAGWIDMHFPIKAYDFVCYGNGLYLMHTRTVKDMCGDEDPHYWLGNFFYSDLVYA